MNRKKLVLPKSPVPKRRGIVGEALGTILFSGFADVTLVNKSDLGIDVHCQLLDGDEPTGRFFQVQVKYYKKAPSIKKTTVSYWSTLDHPVFVLWIKNETNPEKITIEAVIADKRLIKQYPTKFKVRGDKSYKSYNEIIFIKEINIYWDEKDRVASAAKNDRKPTKANNALSLKDNRIKKGEFKITEFLSSLTEKIENQEEILDFDNIRLYLFAAGQLYKQNIPSEILGNHEINLIYTHKEKIKLTINETILILRSVFSDQYHLKPGWFWLKRLKKDDLISFLHHFIIKDLSEDVVLGSLNLLVFFWEDKNFELLEINERFINESVKLKELDIAKEYPSKRALEYTKKYLDDQSERVKIKAQEVYIFLLSKLDLNEAVNYLTTSSATYHRIDPDFYNRLSESDLRRLQNSKDSTLKVEIIKELIDRVLLTEDELLELIKDEDWNIRFLAIKGLITKGFNPTAEQIRTILWSKSTNTLLTTLSRRTHEFDHKELMVNSYLKEPIEHLKDNLAWGYFSDEIYEAIGKKDKQFIIQVRADLINGFNNRKKELLEKVSKAKGVSIAFLDNLNSKYEKDILNLFIIAGLKIILENGDKKDKHLAYKFINNEDYIIKDLSKKILLKYADREDIPMLMELSRGDYSSKFLEKALELSSNKEQLINQILDSSESWMTIIGIAFAYRFNIKIPRHRLNILLNHTVDQVRKFTVIYIMNIFPPKDAMEFFKKYTTDGGIYYNVISLFDLLFYSKHFIKMCFNDKFLSELKNK